MMDIDVIKYLVNEIEQEKNYNLEYSHELEKAKKKALENKEEYYWATYTKYMPVAFKREPRQSVIKANAKKIRQILLKFY